MVYTIGHTVEFVRPGGAWRNADRTAETCTWNLFVLAGNAKDAKQGAKFHPATAENG